MLSGILSRRIPGIWVAIALAALFALAGVYGIGASAGAARLEGRIAEADSTARARLHEGVILRRDATAANGRAAVAEHRADSLGVIAAAQRTTVAARVARATESRMRVEQLVDLGDFSTLPDEVIAALVDADSLRVSVTPMLAADSAVIAELHVVVRTKSLTIALQDSALTAQDAALAARDVEIGALRRQAHPRCGRRCGAVVAGLALETVHQLPRILRWLFPPPRS